MSQFQEPEFNPQDDTNPSIPVRPRQMQPQTVSGWRRAAGWLSLLGAVAFTAATVLLLILPPEAEPAPSPAPQVETNEPTTAPTQTTIPTDEPVVEAPTDVPAQPIADSQPQAVSQSVVDALLAQPLVALGGQSAEVLTGARYQPFTIVSDRKRTEFVTYVAVEGDTINEIALRYGLEPESIAWCNNARIVQVLRPGDALRIPPEDGACHLTIGSATLADVANQYDVDPYVIIDYPLNNLFGTEPDVIPTSGTQLFIPGGQGPFVTWNPGYETVTDDQGNPALATFAPGQPGSCGQVAVGGGAAWGNPLPTGTWVRGFYPGHTGIDIAAPTGTPIYAANSGPVLFAGWNEWGYGNAVAIAHGPFMTLYGHMSDIAVGCGQDVVVGQVIGYVGSTGQSSGPHLHFEIRYNNEPQNPSGTPGVGW